MAEPLLEVVGLSVDYLTDTDDVRAVNRVSFTVEPGEFLGIVGESGSGKSTLLFGLTRLLSPTAALTPAQDFLPTGGSSAANSSAGSGGVTCRW